MSALDDESNNGVRRLREDAAMLLAERFHRKFPRGLLAQHLGLEKQRIKEKRNQEKLEMWPPAPCDSRTRKPRRIVSLA